MLVFLPGAREIRRVQSLLAAGPATARSRCCRSSVSSRARRRMPRSRPPPPARARWCSPPTSPRPASPSRACASWSTPGWCAGRCFDPATGMSRLRDAAHLARLGRAARRVVPGALRPGSATASGARARSAALAPFTPPEILEADLAPLALELAGWGARDAAELRWLDPPPAADAAPARATCWRASARWMRSGASAPHGREMARLPRASAPGAHAAALARPRARGARRAARGAAVGARPAARRPGARDADIRTRLELLRGEQTHAALDRATLERARRAARALERQLGAEPGAGGGRRGAATGAAARLRLSRPHRPPPRRRGRALRARRAAAARRSPSRRRLRAQEFIVAVDLDDSERDARILLAAPLARARSVRAVRRAARAHGRRWSGTRASRRSARATP